MWGGPRGGGDVPLRVLSNLSASEYEKRVAAPPHTGSKRKEGGKKV